MDPLVDLPEIAMTLRQPWCWAVCWAGKRIENRSRPWPWTGLVGRRVLLHAGKGWERDKEAQILRAGGGVCPPRKDPQMVFGSIVAVASVSGLIWPGGRELQTTMPLFPPKRHPRADDPWYQGGFALVFSDVTRLVPVECRGMLGLWTVPAAVRQALQVAA